MRFVSTQNSFRGVTFSLFGISGSVVEIDRGVDIGDAPEAEEEDANGRNEIDLIADVDSRRELAFQRI